MPGHRPAPQPAPEPGQDSGSENCSADVPGALENVLREVCLRETEARFLSESGAELRMRQERLHEEAAALEVGEGRRGRGIEGGDGGVIGGG